MQPRRFGLKMILLALVLLSLMGGGLYWVDSTANSCWKHEATQSFENYKTLKSRSSILRAARSRGLDVANARSNPVEVIEKDPNGCSLGGNGMTVVRFYFDDANKLTTMQVFRNYRTSDPDYTMELIEERGF